MKSRCILRLQALVVPILLLFFLSSCGVQEVEQAPEEKAPPIQEESGPDEVEDDTASQDVAEVQNDTEERQTAADAEESDSGPEVEYTGLCINPYFPIWPEVIWEYIVHSPSETYEYTSQFIDITDISFLEKIESEVFAGDVEWTCTEEGMVQSHYSAAMIEDDTQGVLFNTESYKGVSLPSPGKWSIGFKWVTEYVVNARILVEGEEMLFKGNITIDNEIMDIESVTVPAGTFPEAVKIDSKKDMTVSADLAGNAISSNAHTDISTWYSENTGMIKQVSKATCGTTTVELLSVEENI